jgi:hypothetical protein
MPFHDVCSKPGTVSNTEGRSGSSEYRFSVVTASPRIFAAFEVRDQPRHRREYELDLAADEVRRRRRVAFVGHVRHVGFGELPEKFRCEVSRAADAGRAEVERARFGACEIDEVLHARSSSRR